MVKAPWVQKTKVRHTNLPTHDALRTAKYCSTAADALIQTDLLCRTLGFPFSYDSPPIRGASDPSPGGPFNTPRSSSRSSAPVLSPVRLRAAVWDGRGATARPREAKRSSGVAAVFWVRYNEYVFNPFRHDYHNRGALFKDTTLVS